MIFIRISSIILTSFLFLGSSFGQISIPLDSSALNITGFSMFEKHLGVDAMYLQGSIELKGIEFFNGTIEFDVHLKNFQSFPGVSFRTRGGNSEKFLLRPHLSGKEDANQAAPTTNDITSFQLYFGPKYSFAYTYHYDRWTHVKVVVQDDKAQVYLDHAEQPNHSWYLYHQPKSGGIKIQAGGRSGAQHIANIKIDTSNFILKNFKPIERAAIENLIPEWEVSDKFEEKLLSNFESIDNIKKTRVWQGKIAVEEGTAANIARKVILYDNTEANTVLAKISIDSDKDQLKLFEFGYSDRVVTYLNGVPIYKGNNKYRSRDYRYLGTVGLFDAIFLDLKKGKNELIMAVSEDFGGWLITGRFTDYEGLEID